MADVNIMVAKKCPRRAALSGGGNVGKVGVLRSIAKRIAIEMAKQVPSFTVTKEQLRKWVTEAFSEHPDIMLSFERKAELDRMVDNLYAYSLFERRHATRTVVATEFANPVTFAGKKHSVSAHVLIDRGDCFECIRYAYKLNEYSPDDSRSRKEERNVSNSPELLFLQRTGEVEAQKLGFDISKKPVLGAIFYLRLKKHSKDKDTFEFEEKQGLNIASRYFSTADERRLESMFGSVEADSKVGCNDPAYCRTCVFNELCHIEFVKRKLEVLPPEPPVPINDIYMTDTQRNFVNFRSGECRVNAVAGSGKTTIIMLRTLGLLEEGVDPSHILMLTFTDKAAAEMRKRLEAYAIGDAIREEELDVSRVQIMTFNAWGQSVLEQHYKSLGFAKSPTVVDDIEKKDIIIEVLKKHPSLPGVDYANPFMSSFAHDGAVIEIFKLLDSMKASHVSSTKDVEELVGVHHPFASRADELLEVYQQYNEALMLRGKIDYEDQLRLLLDLDKLGVFRAMPYEHIVVDEFQDSNPNQIEIILKVASQAPNYKSLAVVGDIMQSIYGFRNATPENLADFGKYFPHMVDISMTDNFRSFTPIIQAANNIIEHSMSDIKTTINAHKEGHGLDPVICRVRSTDEELRLYTAQIKKLLKEGTEPADIAILCRTRGELANLRDALAEEGIPVIVRVPEIVGDNAYVKAIVGLAKFLQKGDSNGLALYAASLGIDPFDMPAVKKLGEEMSLKMSSFESEKAKREYFWSLTEDAHEDFIAAQFLDALKARRLLSLKGILGYCVKYDTYGTKEMVSTAHEKSNSVTLITIHSAKGLEWPVVLLSLKKFLNGAEEQRLLYVAVTRAKEKLLITHTDKQSFLVDLLK